MDLRRPWPYAAFLLLAHLASRFLGVAAHEFLGHAAVAWLLGGVAYAAYVSPGAGFTYVYLPDFVPREGAVAMQASGIAVEVALGVAFWWLSRKTDSFAWRVLGLSLAVVFILYSLVYMAVGAFDFFPGDTRSIVLTLGNPLLAAGFVVVAAAWTLIAGSLISLDLVRALGPETDLRLTAAYLLAFWLVPAPVALLPGFAGFDVFEAQPAAYIAAFAVALASVAAVFVYMDLRSGPRRSPTPAPRDRGTWRAIAAAAVPILVLAPVWLVAFGPTPEGAVGVLIVEPPLEAEGGWTGGMAVNLQVVVHPDFSLTLSWGLRGTLEPTSPLDRQIVDSYDDRMDHDFYRRFVLAMTEHGFNETVVEGNWFVETSFISANDTVWSEGRTYDDARIVVVVPSFLNGRSFFASDGNGNIVLTVHDPFKYTPPGFPPSPEGWLDSLKIEWEDPLLPVRFAASGGTAGRTVSANYVLWQPFNRFEAHTTYQVYLTTP